MNLILGIDLQRDFMDNQGSLYIKGADNIKSNIKKIFKEYSKFDIKFWLTADMHDEGDKQISLTPDFINTFPPHCMRNTPGSEFIDEAKFQNNLNDNLNHSIYEKNLFSVFEGNSVFLNHLSNLGNIDNIFIFGVAGDVCVRKVIEGLNKYKGTKVLFNNMYVVYDAIASIDEDKFNIFMTKENNFNYVKVIHTHEFINFKF